MPQWIELASYDRVRQPGSIRGLSIRPVVGDSGASARVWHRESREGVVTASQLAKPADRRRSTTATHRYPDVAHRSRRPLGRTTRKCLALGGDEWREEVFEPNELVGPAHDDPGFAEASGTSWYPRAAMEARPDLSVREVGESAPTASPHDRTLRRVAGSAARSRTAVIQLKRSRRASLPVRGRPRRPRFQYSRVEIAWPSGALV